MSQLFTRWRMLALFLVLSLSLLGCQKNIPEDRDAQQQAVQVMNEYLVALFESQDKDYLKTRTAVPFWVNSQRFESVEDMLEDLMSSELGEVKELKIKVISAEFKTLEQVKVSEPRLWDKLEDRGLTGEHLYAIQVSIEFMAKEFGSDKDNGWVLMSYGDDGKWRVHGLQ